ncbi:phage antirepressor KilAC domain-containing protein [bacterium]|nr:phage antirepressor KilAC domain-containing protein [bacterium]
MKLQTIAHQNVDFYGTSIPTAQLNDQVFVAMRPVVEGMGLNWSVQQKKLNKNRSKFSCVLMDTTGADGKQYSMLHMLLRKLNGWLFTINPEKVKPEIKETVIRYQEECFQVLHDYWHNGFAIKQEPTTCQTLKEKVDFFDSVASSNDLFTFNEVSKMKSVELGQNTLFDLLRRNNILMDSNIPYQQHIKSGLFKVSTVTLENGSVIEQTFFTGKGIIWLKKQLPVLVNNFSPEPVFRAPKKSSTDRQIEALMMDLVAPENEIRKKQAVEIKATASCCGKTWDLNGKFCGTCAKPLLDPNSVAGLAARLEQRNIELRGILSSFN